MYAIVEILGQQFKVAKNQHIYTNRIDVKEGDKIDFDKVLLTEDKEQVTIGSPNIEGALVSAKVLEHLKGDKVTVFKKKRRKGYRVKNGFRQHLTKLEIQKISTNGSKEVKASVKKATVKKATVKKATVKKDTVKKATVKKATVKKATVKKAK